LEAWGTFSSNLWQIGVNTPTGTSIGKPKRITRWEGSGLEELSASADGARLVMQKVSYPAQVYLGELGAGVMRMSPPKRLTNDEADDSPSAWTADSKAILFSSDRDGKWGVFKQGIDQDTAEPLVAGRERVHLPRLSPNGAWVLYMEDSKTAVGYRPLHRLMRIPVNGGIPELVFESPRPLDFQCAMAPASVCVILERSEDNKRLTLSAFDPLKGKGRPLLGLDAEPFAEGFGEGLSPDGSTFAIARHDDPEIHIRLLSLSGGSDREITVKGWPSITGLNWSADGKGLYCGSTSSQGGSLLYVDLKGTAQVLWQSREVGGGGAFIAGHPSPDGRYVAIWGSVRKSNVWMVEGF
jgi:Tol biopolymer transport system component